MNEALRHTGRTTRLLEHACRAAEQGRAVYYFVETARMAKLFEQFVERAWNVPGRDLRRGHGIKVENMAHWDYHGLWDWADMQPRNPGAHPNCLFLVDHHTVEQKLTSVQAEIKRLAELAGKLYPHTV